MNPKLIALCARQDGVFSRRDALVCGYSDVQIHARVRAGQWMRLHRGAYISADRLGAAGALRDGVPAGEVVADKHRLRIRAAVACRSGVVASHQSAITAHGLPSWGLDLRAVHLTRTDERPSKRSANVVVHKARSAPSPVTTSSGIDAVPLARAVVETAALATFEAGVVVADAALHSGLVGSDDLAAALADLGPVRGSRLAALVIGFADAAAESVGESRLRVLMDQMGLPRPVPQYVVRDESGQFVGRVDFCLPGYATVIEFDGLVKYREDAAATVVREKTREDRLRELGHEVVRVVWSDLDAPRATALRIVRALGRGRARMR